MRFTIAVMGLHAVHFPHLSDYPVRSLRDQTRYFPETFRERVVIAGVIEVARSLDPLLYQFHLSQFACDENSVTDRQEFSVFLFLIVHDPVPSLRPGREVTPERDPEERSNCRPNSHNDLQWLVW